MTFQEWLSASIKSLQCVGEDEKDMQLSEEENIKGQMNDIEKRIKQILKDEKEQSSAELVKWKIKRKKSKPNLNE